LANISGRKSRTLVCGKIPSNYRVSEDTLNRVSVEIKADAKETLRVLNAVSNPIRLRILRALKVDELCVCVFVSVMKCRYSKLSYHLKLLKTAGLVDSKKDRNFLSYKLTPLGKRVLESVES
jgi:ArsR family transcriptional regulator, lead/cadmium/zinc/bismuth-responsive transcriptional repressor